MAMTGKDWASLLTGVGGATLGAIGGAKDRAAQTALTREQLAEQRRQFDLSHGQSQATNALAATQMNPFAQQQSRQRAALVAALMAGYRPASYANGVISGGLNVAPGALTAAMPTFAPEALSAAEQHFQANAARNPAYVTPGAATAPTPPRANPLDDLVAQVRAGGGSGTGVGNNVLSRGATGAMAGMQFGGPVGAAIGGGLGALTGLITSNRNDTKGARESAARAMGFPSLDALYQALASAGPQGQELMDIGLNVIGRKDAERNALWIQAVQQLLGGAAPPAGTPSMGGKR